MKTVLNVILFLLLGLVSEEAVKAQFLVPYSVFGNGGATLSGSFYSIVGTLGQPAIGRLTNSSNIHEVGFWYLPSQSITGVEREPGEGLPTEYRLEQNYPNPFNPSTTVGFSVPRVSYVSLKVFSLLGVEVATLTDQDITAGNYRVEWNAKGVASGVYIYRLIAGSFVDTKKMLLLR